MEKLVNDFAYGLFFWQALILIVLILLLRKYAWRPVLNSLDKIYFKSITYMATIFFS